MSKLITLDTHIVKAIKSNTETETITIEGYANTVAKDRAYDVITADAWTAPEALTNYKKNPIILFSHDYTRPIGKCVELRPDNNGLYISADIVKATDPAVYSMIENEILKTFSVGFRCLEADWHDISDTFIITKLELFEISVVAVPCNQDSTFQVAKGMDGKSFEDFRKEFLATQNIQTKSDSEFDKLVKRIYDAIMKGNK